MAPLFYWKGDVTASFVGGIVGVYYLEIDTVVPDREAPGCVRGRLLEVSLSTHPRFARISHLQS